jgi:hypothetical protein
MFDLSARQETKTRETEEQRNHVANLLECDGILTDAIEQMWLFADRDEILKTLRHAVAVLELGKD